MAQTQREWGGSIFSGVGDMVLYAYLEWACVGTDYTPETAPEPTRESIHEMQTAAGEPWIDDVTEDEIAAALGVA